MDNIMDGPFLVFFSKQHALELARDAALLEIVFGLVASDPRSPHHNSKLTLRPVRRIWDITKGESGGAVAGTLVLPLSMPAEQLAKEVSAYLDRYKDSEFITKSAYYTGHKGLHTAETLELVGKDHEDIYLSLLNGDPGMQSAAADAARRFGWKNTNQSFTTLYSAQHALQNAKLRMIDRIVLSHVISDRLAEDATTEFLDTQVNMHVTSFYRDLNSGNEKEVSYVISNALPKDEREALLGAFRTRWTDSHVLSYDAVFARYSRDAKTVLATNGMDEEDAQLAMHEDPKVATYANNMAQRFRQQWK